LNQSVVAVGLARIVDRNDDEVFPSVQLLGGFTVEGGESPLVIAYVLPVDPDQCFIVGRAYMQKGSVMGLGLIVEIALVPDHTFVVEELVAL